MHASYIATVNEAEEESRCTRISLATSDLPLSPAARFPSRFMYMRRTCGIHVYYIYTFIKYTYIREQVARVTRTYKRHRSRFRASPRVRLFRLSLLPSAISPSALKRFNYFDLDESSRGSIMRVCALILCIRVQFLVINSSGYIELKFNLVL